MKTITRLKNAVTATRRAAALQGGATPHEVVWRSGPVRLRYYAPTVADVTDGAAPRTPLLLVTPIINRFRVVDLAPESSLVGSLVAQGLPVYLVDWGDVRRIDGGTDWEDYVLRYLRRAADVVGARHPGAGMDLAGYCLGGTIAVLFAARFPERVRKLVTLTTPVDFSGAEPHMDLLRQWVAPATFPVERITEAFGAMPGRLIQQGFLWQRPVDSAFKLRDAWPRFQDLGFARFFSVLESWNQDAVDVPGAAYRRLIRDLYNENHLARGTFLLGREPVDLGRITCPVLVVAADRDTTCPPPAAKALLDLVGSTETRYLELRGGHIAPIVGPKAKDRLHVPLARWLAGEPVGSAA